MTEPILVIDPGARFTSAAVVADRGMQLIKEPSSGSYSWPTSVALDGDVLRVGTIAERRKRSNLLLYASHLTESLRLGRQVTLGDHSYRSHELIAVLLHALRTEAVRLAGVPVDRVLLMVGEDQSPATAAGRAMIAAADTVGFTDVELLFLPLAVTMAADLDTPPQGGPVLVGDAGASALRLTLVQPSGGWAGAMRAEAIVPTCGGDNLDTLLTAAITKNAKWLRPLLAAGEPDGGRARMDLADLARRVRHELTDSDQAEDTLTALTPVVRFTRQDLERSMRSVLGEVSSACRGLLVKAEANGGAGAGPKAGGISGVVLVGGCARTPAIQRALSTALGRPLTPVPAPELAALRGGIEWARSAASRRVPAALVPVGLRGLAWDIPGDAARLAAWSLAPGASYDAGEALARIRTEDDAIWDLTSDRPGLFEQPSADIGAIVATADVLAVVRQTSVIPADRRDTPLRLGAVRGGQSVAFSEDSRHLATLDAAGTVRIWDVETAIELTQAVVKQPGQPRTLDLAAAPDRRWITAIFDGTAVLVRDLITGVQRARVAKGNDEKTVQFSGDGRYLCVAEAKRSRIWDVSGREVLSVRERLLSSDAVTISRDGRRLALASRNGIELWNREPRRRTIIRPLPRFSGRVWRMAFSPDASSLLFAVDSRMEMIQLPGGESMWTVDVPGPVLEACFSPDGTLLATLSHPPANSAVWLREAATGHEAGRIDAAAGTCARTKFSPDGRFLVCTEDDTTGLWALLH
jgi:hypothetical protein